MAVPTEMLSTPVVEVESCCCSGLHSPPAASAASCACHVCPVAPHLLAVVAIQDFKLSPPIAAHGWTSSDESAPGFCPEPMTPPPRAAV
ncbi:MAG: hypothetical protein ACKOHM_09370 [Spartobacteria bacterium]